MLLLLFLSVQDLYSRFNYNKAVSALIPARPRRSRPRSRFAQPPAQPARGRIWQKSGGGRRDEAEEGASPARDLFRVVTVVSHQ